jgi:hypothetical protein
LTWDVYLGLLVTWDVYLGLLVTRYVYLERLVTWDVYFGSFSDVVRLVTLDVLRVGHLELWELW